MPPPLRVKARSIVDCRSGKHAGYNSSTDNRGNQVQGHRMSEKFVWQVRQPYCEGGRRSGNCATRNSSDMREVVQAAVGSWTQIQWLIGHASVKTTERIAGHEADICTRRTMGSS